MFKIVKGLLLGLLALNSLAHQSHDHVEHEVSHTLIDIIKPTDGEIVEALKIDSKHQPQKVFQLLSSEVPPAQTMRLSWQLKQSLAGLHQPTPVLVVNGSNAGPTMCLTAAIHGDELNGIEIVRRILHHLDPQTLSGTVVGVPIVNLQGFHRSSRYLTDSRDLNRFFPGNPQGNSAARIAYSFFQEVISHCDFLVDIHTGSAYRTNLPQIRGNLYIQEVAAFAHAFGISVILHSVGTEGMLRHAAVNAGIPAVTLEAGKSNTLQESAIQHGVESILTMLDKLGMTKSDHPGKELDSVYYRSEWVRVDNGGLLYSHVQLGDKISKDMVLGVVTDPITNLHKEILSPYHGQIIGMAVDQVVMPGFASFHIGIPETERKIARMEHLPEKQNTLTISRTLESE